MIYRIVMALLFLWLAVSLTLILGFSAGYIHEKRTDIKDERCINSACEGKCKAKFVRHQGACEK